MTQKTLNISEEATGEKVLLDVPTSPQRHANMAAIHGKDTKPEMVVRRYEVPEAEPLLAAEDFSGNYGNE